MEVSHILRPFEWFTKQSTVTVHLGAIRYLDKGHMMFIEPGKLQDRELLLALDRYLKVDPEKEGAPTYYFRHRSKSRL